MSHPAPFRWARFLGLCTCVPPSPGLHSLGYTAVHEHTGVTHGCDRGNISLERPRGPQPRMLTCEAASTMP
eukprot:4479448-Amphidinium_carterae.2